MEIDGEMVRQVALSVGAVAVFVAAAVAVSTTHGETATGTDLTPTGGLALVGVLALFIAAMAIAGLWLERQDFDS